MQVLLRKAAHFAGEMLELEPKEKTGVLLVSTVVPQFNNYVRNKSSNIISFFIGFTPVWLWPLSIYPAVVEETAYRVYRMQKTRTGWINMTSSRWELDTWSCARPGRDDFG